MAGILERSLSILEYLAAHPEGAQLAIVAQDLGIPGSACHRLLSELTRCGYVRQVREHGDYALTTKLAAIGLSFLGASGIVDVAQPIIDRVAALSGELVRLAIIDEDRLTFVAKSQGAKFGLKYDPDMGIDVCLSCSSAGHSWMMTLTDERAIELVTKQGFGSPERYGPKAPTTMKALLKIVQEDRKRGFSMINEMYAPGMTAMAAPIQRKGEAAIGVITIAGPQVRLTEKRMLSLGPDLIEAAAELALASSASPILLRRAAK